jgi:DNA-directed RNA polymerase specialized sigma subunit
MNEDVQQSVIHLRKEKGFWAQRFYHFEHELNVYAEKKLSRNEAELLMQRHLRNEPGATDDLIIGHICLIYWLVGRYVHHWVECRRFIDDMYSEGLLALVQSVKEIDESQDIDVFRGKVIVRTKSNIENMLNNLRFPVNASLSTNFRRIRDSKPTEHKVGESFNESLGGVYSYDDGPTYVDLLDSLRALQEVDSEEMVDLVLLAMEQRHNILEQDLTDKERDMINILSKLGGHHA